MAPDEYATGGGGKLKLKGSKVSDGRVEKKKKKKGSKKKDDVKPTEGEESGSGVPDDRSEDRAKSEDKDSLSDARSGSVGKTETERKHEELRKKRMHERLQREGVKTHKERVEELNKYLSRLSEHHDMPKIGPG
ncbi:uncharacterized protein N7503_006440 [Penicillium pulvis]|uniref:uncharacterized protein n=1 Tax=Penicillium pulvis TaxID=1562058 RepID=UPI0025489D60|nr:uncharacterized protein N7503_006440 [Penicillium pulvis]KAJ5798935.1 hypothetical protein N7503_006440 [Penicillium pulvis]